MNNAVVFCTRARVPATNPPGGGGARRSRRGACWWDATRPLPPPAGVPRCAGLLRGIALASLWPWLPTPTPRRPSQGVRVLDWGGVVQVSYSLEPPYLGE